MYQTVSMPEKSPVQTALINKQRKADCKLQQFNVLVSLLLVELITKPIITPHDIKYQYILFISDFVHGHNFKNTKLPRSFFNVFQIIVIAMWCKTINYHKHKIPGNDHGLGLGLLDQL